MSVLSAVLDAVRSGGVEIVDLTTPLQASTPILRLPEPFGNTRNFALEEISRYDDRGPAWYWNDIHTGEHTGTHLDAPVHWVTGRDGLDVSQAPMRTLVAPAAVIDKTAEAAAARRRSGRRGGVAAGAAGPASGGRREGPGGRAVVVAGGGLPRSLAVVSENHRSSHDFHSRPTVRP